MYILLQIALEIMEIFLSMSFMRMLTQRLAYQNVSFLSDTIFSIGFEIQDRGSFYDYRYQVMYDLEIKFREASSSMANCLLW